MAISRRHYPKIKGLVVRTTRDVTPQAMGVRSSALKFLDDLRPPLPQAPSLVSSAFGAFEEILLTIPDYAVVAPFEGQANPLAAAYQDLIAKLPKAVRFVVLTHASVEQEVRRWFEAAGAGQRSSIIPAPDHLHFSIWAEDGYVVIKDGKSQERYFVEPFEFPRYADGLIADLVANATSLQSTQAPLYFQGGNVLIGDDYFMIGADYPANSLRYINRVIAPNPGEAPAEAVKRLYRTYLDPKREVIYVGATIPVPSETTRELRVDGEKWTEVLYFGNKEGTVQPLFHIDMFITLAGRDEKGAPLLVVGDPRLAARTLNVPLWEHAMAEVFDNIARGLQRRGFKVVRSPLPLAHMDDPDARERIWYFATSNNALVQLDGKSKKIWLPTYGHGAWKALKATDDANKAVWESLGFEVTQLADFHPFAENLGAVHCIKKYLSRA